MQAVGRVYGRSRAKSNQGSRRHSAGLSVGRRVRRGIGLLGILSLIVGGLGVAASAATSLVEVPGQSAVPAGAVAVGATSPTRVLNLVVALSPQHPHQLSELADAVSTPGDPEYHHYLTPSEFATEFGASSSQVAGLRQYLSQAGLSVGAESANGLSLAVSGPVTAVGAAFHTGRFENFKLPSGRVAYAATSGPRLPASVAPLVSAVIGLSDFVRAHDQVALPSGPSEGAISPSASTTVTVAPDPDLSNCAGASGVGLAYDAQDLASAYNFDALYGQGQAGQGVTAAVFELAGYNANDIAVYQHCYGTSVPITNIAVQLGATVGAGTVEVELDIEDLISLAPELSKLEVYEAPNTGTGLYDEYSRIASDGNAQVVSTSWGICEPDAIGSGLLGAENTVFQEMATQGQTVVADAGDDGSEGCLGSDDSTALAVDDPASQPYVTGVGGTDMTAPSNPPAESVWNEAANQAGAGGGGISERWPMAAWQAGPGVVNAYSSGAPCNEAEAANQAGAGGGGISASSGYCREVPDVSASADPYHGYAIFCTSGDCPNDRINGWGDIGGTSAAAPLWAALIADVDSGCSAPAGFLNPTLYSSFSSGALSLNDITVGNNDYTGTNNGDYPATVGYDMASGIGTPEGPTVAANLCPPTSSQAAPVFTAGTPALTATANSTYSYTFVASGNPSPTYSLATGAPTFLSINATTGVLSGVPPTGTASFTYSVVAANSVSSATAGPFTVTVLAGGYTTASSLAFVTSPVGGPASQPASANLGPITVELESCSTRSGPGRSASCSPVPAPSGGVPVTLRSTSTTAVFSATPSGATTNTVTIPAGAATVSFYYGDSTPTSATVTATVPTATAELTASQVENVTSGSSSSGATVTMSPTALNLDSTVGGSSTGSFSVRNFGPGRVTIGSLTLAGTAPTGATFAGSFQILPTSTCQAGLVLDSGQSCTLAVEFHPDQAGSYSGALTVVLSGAGSPDVVASLSGTAGGRRP